MTPTNWTLQNEGEKQISQDSARATPNSNSHGHRSRWSRLVHHPIRTTGYYLVLIYVFIIFSQFHQLLAWVTNIDTHLLLIVGVPMVFLVLVTGGLSSVLQWSPAKYWVCYSAWMVIAVPFSLWRGESFHITVTWLRVEVLILFVIAGCVVTWREIRLLMTVLAWAAIVDVLAGRIFAGQIVGRLALEMTGTTMSDPNDYAALLILVLPCLVLFVVSASRSIVVRICAVGVSLYGIYLILITGSRGALVAICTAILFCLWRLRPNQKLLMVTLVLLLTCAAVITVPERILTRLSLTFRSADSVDQGVDSATAIGTQQARMYLLKESILATLSHPLFGVGAGQFKDYEGRKALDMGHKGSWHQTHNSLTQVSSEIGLPALFFFLGAIVATYRMLDRVYRVAQRRPQTNETQQIKATAFCLLVSLVGFCAASLFLSMAYRFYLPALTGITIALYRLARQKWTSSIAGEMTVPQRVPNSVRNDQDIVPSGSPHIRPGYGL